MAYVCCDSNLHEKASLGQLCAHCFLPLTSSGLNSFHRSVPDVRLAPFVSFLLSPDCTIYDLDYSWSHSKRHS